ncbi:MAG: hypothetical protein Kow0032_28870 [Methyloligellaceae bacterium]
MWQSDGFELLFIEAGKQIAGVWRHVHARYYRMQMGNESVVEMELMWTMPVLQTDDAIVSRFPSLSG